MAPLYAILSGVIVLIGAPFYLIDIFKGKTKPERTTWFIWSVLGIIAFFSQAALHAHWSLVYAALDAVGSLIVFGLSLKFGVGGWTRLDRFALCVAVVGVLIALIAHAPIIAILGVMLADGSGAVLTIRKTYRSPGSETTITWFGVGMSALFGALAVGHFKLSLLLYPLFVAAGAFVVLSAKGLGHLADRKRPKLAMSDIV